MKRIPTPAPPPRPARPDPTPGPEVCILLAVYNGKAHLPAQLESYGAQSHANWSLLAFDDGSSDGSPDLVRAFAADHPDRRIACRAGPGKGFVRNFLTLLQSLPDSAEYAALSDQDDVWFADKLERAIAALRAVPADRPAIYCAATMICDADLAPLRPSAAFRRRPDFRNALVQSIGGGNTMVLNRAAVGLAAAAAAATPDPVAHDWWLYQLVTGHDGVILRDPEPVLYYRQHGANLIGANVTWSGRITRLLALAGGRFRRWNRISLAALSTMEAGFSPAARDTLAHYRAARSGPPGHRLRHLRASGVYRQSRAGTAALYLACLLGRI